MLGKEKERTTSVAINIVCEFRWDLFHYKAANSPFMYFYLNVFLEQPFLLESLNRLRECPVIYPSVALIDAAVRLGAAVDEKRSLCRGVDKLSARVAC